MVPSDLKRLALRTGLSFAAALMLSTAAFAQDATSGDEVVLNAVDPVVEIDPIFAEDPLPADIEVQFGHDLNPGDGEGIAVGEPDPNGGGTDDGTVVDDRTVQDDGSVDPGTDDTSGGEPIDDGTVVIYYMDGGPIDCVECRDETAGLPDVALEMGGADPVVLDHVKRTTRSRASTLVQMSSVSDVAACLEQYPQLPWICEWQIGASQ